MAKSSNLEPFLSRLASVRATGAALPETSYYPAFEALLSGIGAELSPRVRAIVHVQDSGGGIPDGGFFVDRARGPMSLQSPLTTAPERGVLEIKSPDHAMKSVLASKQVKRYLERYGAVLVSTFREWALIVQDDETGQLRTLESYEIASSETAFWEIVAHRTKFAAAHEAPFTDFLRRVLQHEAPLTNPEDLAWFLAAYARAAIDRIEGQTLPALATLREAMEESFELKFEGDEGEHFFHSTLVQTLFYGIFSAWVLWAHAQPPDARSHFHWHEAVWWLNVPMVRVLFHQIATPSTLGPLQLTELMDWSEEVLNRVDRTAFFARFEDTQAVQYFYEPFLKAFDPELRKNLGVWYTPHEVVQYMVAKVDRTLREDFELPMGLADPRVYVLDPCTGTGSYLVEVLRRIADTIADQYGDALVANDMKTAALQRVIGFEILPASFVIAHLQLGLLLAERGAALDTQSGERAAVYLTNSLTGWIKEEASPRLPFVEFEEERDAARAVKRDAPILVVLGNPPYNGFAGVSPREEGDLVAPYKQGLKQQWGITKNYLDDLYVRFFRIAQRRIVDETGQGIVCFISNYSYLSDPTYVVMRQHFISEFDHIWIDCLNGDSRETGKRTPDGHPDPSIFSTQQNPPGIRVGTAIGQFIRKERHSAPADVNFREYWGSDKREQLLSSLESSAPSYVRAAPTASNRYSFRPSSTPTAYYEWPSLRDLCRDQPSLGLNENRGLTLTAIDRAPLEERMRAYLDPRITFEQLPESLVSLTKKYAGFAPTKVRDRLTPAGYKSDQIKRYLFKPLDVRWAYVETRTNVWNRARPELVAQAKDGTRFLLVRPSTPRANDGAALLFSRCLGDMDCMDGHAYYIPLEIVSAGPSQSALFAAEHSAQPNLSASAVAYLDEIGTHQKDEDRNELLWLHALAIGYSSAYLTENGDGLRSGWLRLPLPSTKESLRASATLGRRLSELVDPLVEVPGVTTAPEDRFKLLGVIRSSGNGPLTPDDLVVSAGWGHPTKDGSTMPGQGRSLHRSPTSSEVDHYQQAGSDVFGSEVIDVFLNDTAFWSCVPVPVWEYRIGGHQVLKKWLSYREARVIGRALIPTEAREFTNMVRRLAVLVLLLPVLDRNYEGVRDSAASWAEFATRGQLAT